MNFVQFLRQFTTSVSHGIKNLLRRQLIFATLLVVFLLIIHAILTLAASIKLSLALHNVRAQHIPLTAAEIRRPTISDQENAAIYYQRAYSVLELDPNFQKYNEKGNWYATLEERKYTEVLPAPAATEKIIALIKEGASKTICNFSLNYEAGFNMSHQHQIIIDKLSRLLMANAMQESSEGRREEAFEMILLGLKMANHLGQEPEQGCQLTRLSCTFYLMRVFQKIFDEQCIPYKQTVLMLSEMKKFNRTQFECFDTTRITFVWLFQSLIAHKIYPDPTLSMPESFSWEKPKGFSQHFLLYLCKPLIKNDFSTYLVRFPVVEKLYGAPYYQVSDQLSWDSEHFWCSYVGQDEKLKKKSKLYFFTSWYLSNSINGLERFSMGSANIDFCLIGIALKTYQAKHGFFPNSLSELVPEIIPAVPIDLFTGKPAYYLKTKNGFTLSFIRWENQDEKISITKGISFYPPIWNE